MELRRTGWLAGLSLLGSMISANAMADGTLLGLYNPLGLYAGAGVGRATVNQTQFDDYGDVFRHIDGQPLGWNAVIGVRPIPILGAEAEYIDFGNKHLAAGAPFVLGGYTQQFLGGEAHDRAGAVFAVGYLPLPIPWVEPFAKLGWAQIWEHDSYSGIYAIPVNGVPIGQASASQNTQPLAQPTEPACNSISASLRCARSTSASAVTDHLAVGRANPTLLSVGLNWTF